MQTAIMLANASRSERWTRRLWAVAGHTPKRMRSTGSARRVCFRRNAQVGAQMSLGMKAEVIAPLEQASVASPGRAVSVGRGRLALLLEARAGTNSPPFARRKRCQPSAHPDSRSSSDSGAPPRSTSSAARPGRSSSVAIVIRARCDRRVGRAHCCARPPSEPGRASFPASGSSKP